MCCIYTVFTLSLLIVHFQLPCSLKVKERTSGTWQKWISQISLHKVRTLCVLFYVKLCWQSFCADSRSFISHLCSEELVKISQSKCWPKVFCFFYSYSCVCNGGEIIWVNLYFFFKKIVPLLKCGGKSKKQNEQVIDWWGIIFRTGRP